MIPNAINKITQQRNKAAKDIEELKATMAPTTKWSCLRLWWC